MFDPSAYPRIFALSPGVDFARALIDGIYMRMQGCDPADLARIQLIVNTRRSARKLRDVFDSGPPGFLPRIGLVTDLGAHWVIPDLPAPVSPLRRRLELMRVVTALLDQEPDLAPRSSAFDLAQSLADLMDEMHGEGVEPDKIANLDVSDQSGHWGRIQVFLTILRPYFDSATDEPDIETRQRLAVEYLIRQWQSDPPQHPILLAGSTGSRGTTRLLMQAIAQLPQGAVILPGFDFDMPADAWRSLTNRMFAEDHPQHRFYNFLTGMNMTPDQVLPWHSVLPASPARNRVLSLALRPAPVTDQWLEAGPAMAPDIQPATAGITLLEAPNPRTEAVAIAMGLRNAVEQGQTAALITPDRTLTRQVTAALDRWSILPDDSAGIPLHQSAPGRFLRHVADLFLTQLTAESLLTLLKHPLAHRGSQRGEHLRLTRELELHLRRYGPPYPDANSLRIWIDSQRDPFTSVWGEWLTCAFCNLTETKERPLGYWIERHIALAETIAIGCADDKDISLWSGDDGAEARRALDNLIQNADAAGPMSARDYTGLFQAVLSAEQVRNPAIPHPDIHIWGTLEARVQTADLIILAGLNEGSWPQIPAPDPWLNRNLRVQAGLLLPEQRIGLSAHDFQQAAASGQVWLSRSLRSAETETVPSRWLNRLQNLLGGLKEQGGADALADMRKRGQLWLNRVRQLEEPMPLPKAERPAPCPPTGARPKGLSVTEIQRLIRDPYSIYAKHVLRLRPLNPLMREPDALLRGIILHKVLELFIKETQNNPDVLTREHLLILAEKALSETVPWASSRALWLARLGRVADKFINDELTRRAKARPTAFEAKGKLVLASPEFTLSATADRIDIDQSGNLILYDYKTGAPPSPKQQQRYDKQLLLETVIAEQAGFANLVPSHVIEASYIGLNKEGVIVAAPLDECPPAQIMAEFTDLIAAYADPDQGYISRRAMHKQDEGGDYDHLARFGEWTITDNPQKIHLS